MSTRARSRSRPRAAVATGAGESTFLNWTASKLAAKADLANAANEDTRARRRVSIGGHARPVSRSRSRSRAAGGRRRSSTVANKRSPLKGILPWAALVLGLAFLLSAITRIKEVWDLRRDHETLLASKEIITTDPFGTALDLTVAQALDDLDSEKHKLKEAQQALRNINARFETIFGAGGLIQTNEDLTPAIQTSSFAQPIESNTGLRHTLHDLTVALEVLSFDAHQQEVHDPGETHRREAVQIITHSHNSISEIEAYTPAQRTWAGIEFAFLPRQFYEPIDQASGGGPVAGLWFFRWEKFLSTRQGEASKTSNQAAEVEEILDQFDLDYERYQQLTAAADDALNLACKEANDKHKTGSFHHKTDVCEAIHNFKTQHWVEDEKERNQVTFISQDLSAAISQVRSSYRWAGTHAEQLSRQIEPLQKRLLADGRSAALGKFQEMVEEFLESA
ncbi:uncharacterized protein CLAFUR5_10062 [Fulvia fulva]|uniref:Uncharacterized protein n=1 Tax=Passalora fulva TaxID=5499 RepID=A0A9Q8URC5_PASFU|nr:uncharacterized protein CLAFUR5_10062 [Fulvia fulva]UJO19585.1 hypothetical protein CLAFUR5_10062 [Fulvia fulva]